MKKNSKYLKFKIPKGINHKKVKSNFTSYFSPLNFTKGMTLVEVLVSLTIMMIVLGAVFSIMNIQRTKAINVQTTSIMQTDANVALTLLRWDIFMAGYGLSDQDETIRTLNSSSDNDSLGMFSMAFGFEASRTSWAPILDRVNNSSLIPVFRFDDSLANFSVGDEVAIISQERKLLHANLVISNIDTAIFSTGADTVPSFDLTVTGGPVTVGKGTICIGIDSTSYFEGISYYINNQNQLMRGNEIFLENVEDVQFAYGVDDNNNGVIEPGEWQNDLTDPKFTPSYIANHTTLIRATFVVLSEKGMGDYTYHADTISIEDHTYFLNASQKKHKRVIVRSVTFPRNMRG